MEIEEIRLRGFKSFADSVLLPLSRGVTVVVGPNGSGKSNIVDALRWLGGEGSVRRLRGGDMEDLIFGGSGGRLPSVSQEVGLKMVDVSLESVGVLGEGLRERAARESVSGFLSLDLVRHLERGKGSHYRVNGDEVLKRDINIFFGDAGFGGLSMSIVGQGLVSEVVRMNGEDRRRMIESSSGLQGLRERYGEAGVKLRGVEENLERLGEYVEVYGERIRELRVQAKKAKRYEEYGLKIRVLETHILRRKLELSEEEFRRCCGEEEEALRNEREGEQELEKERESYKVLKEELEGKRLLRDERLLWEQKKIFLWRHVEAEEEQVRAGLERLERERERNEEDRVREEALCVQARDRLEALEKKRREWEGKKEGESLRKEAQEALDCGLREKGEKESQMRKAHHEWIEEKMRAEKLRSQLDLGRKRVEEQRSQGETLEAEYAKILAEMGRDSVNYDEKREEAEGRLRALEEEREQEGEKGLEAEKGYEDFLKDYGDRYKSQEEALLAVRTRKSNAEVERRTLLGVMEEEGVEGGIAESIEVEEGYEALVDRVLGKGVCYPCIEEGERFSGWRDLGGFAGQEFSVGVEVLRGRVKIPRALERVMGSVGVVETNEEGWEKQGDLQWGQTLVSREGGLWRWDGYVEEDVGFVSVLSTRARCDRLGEVYEEACKEEEVLELEMREGAEGKKREDEKMEAWRRAYEERCRALELRMEEERSKVREYGEAARTRAHEDELLGLRAGEKKEALEAMRVRLGKEEEEYANHEREYGERGDLVLLEDFYRESAKLHEASVKRWEVLKAKSMELDREGRMVEEMLDSLLRDEGEWRRDLGSSEDRLGLLRVRGEEILGERKDFEGRLEALEGEKQGILEEMKESTAKREEAERIVEEVEKRERIFEEGRREREKVYIELKEQVARVRTHKEMWKDRLEEARVIYEERGGLDSEFALEEGVSLEDLEGMIEDFRDKRDRLGSINLLALDELGEKEGEHEDRLRQIEDVRAAAEALQVSCKDLEREAGEKFLLIFGEINDYFQEHFSRIFGGGRAQLRLSREGDILGSGVEIEVEFLGKRVSTLSLLSGGEQALVALCLMFAMFRVHRAPLYVLDEVDAALDDVNVGKFCELMKMSGEEWGMRFLVVTHHRLTMAMADRLFGVTMVEKGVSKLVAVDVEEAVDRWSLEGGVMEEGVVG